MVKLKPLEVPPEVARRFFEDMRAFHREPNPIKRDEIAARQLDALRGYRWSRDKKLRLSDVKELFELMRKQSTFLKNAATHRAKSPGFLMGKDAGARVGSDGTVASCS